VRDIFITGSYAYIAADTSSLLSTANLWVLDISNPVNPTIIGGYNLPRKAGSVVVAGNYAYFAAAGFPGSLRIVDISDPTAMVEVGSYKTPGDAESIAVSGNYAYIADGSEGLRIVDISDPFTPTEVSFYNPADPPFHAASDVTIIDDYVYVTWTGLFAGLRIVDVSNPMAPVEIGLFHPNPGSSWGAHNVTVSGDYAYLSGGSAPGLWVIDISDPTLPVFTALYQSPFGDVWETVITESYAYVTAGVNGLRVVSIADPANPSEVGIYNPGDLGNAQGLEVRGGNVYLADGDLRVVDVSNPVALVIGQIIWQ